MSEGLRFVVNGLIATAVHYAVLRLNLDLLGFLSAGLANSVAAVFGIATSFVGSRLFVFPGRSAGWASQLWRFVALYAGIALLHGVLMSVWHDLWGLPVDAGFVIATGAATACSFFGNRNLVFKGAVQHET